MGEDIGDVLVVASATEDTEDTSVVGELIDELEELIVLVLIDDVAEAEDVAPRRTRKPGLDNSPLFGSYFGPESLKRRTYLASPTKVLSGIVMVQA